MSNYKARKQRGIAEYKWRRARREHYQNLTLIADGFAGTLGFFTFMALVKADGLSVTGLLLMATASALCIGFILNERSKQFFISDRLKVVTESA